MRPSSRALAAGLLLAASGSRAANPRRAAYDPEVALLIRTIQERNVEFLREELALQAERLKLGAMQVMLSRNVDEFARNVSSNLTADSDVLEDYRRHILKIDQTAIGEVDRLVAEIRRDHDLVPGGPLTRLPKPPPGLAMEFLEGEGAGADATSSFQGTPAMDAPVAYAERRFGAAGLFLLGRKWSLDFYLGAFNDPVQRYYRNLGYRRAYRLRSPNISRGKEVYVLSPEPGLRPRIVYAGFQGQDLFLHARAQWSVLAERAKASGPATRTLTCLECAYVPPGVSAMRSLLATVPYTADTVIAGYGELFEPAWRDTALGVYENDYWRLAYYRTGKTITATVVPRRTNYGEILAASLTPLVQRGAGRVYYAGPAARTDETLEVDGLLFPTEFVSFDGRNIPFDNVLAPRKRKQVLFAGMPSPLFATREWLKDARGRGILAYDGEMERLAEAAEAWKRIGGRKVECGIAAVLGGVSSLHPEEDRFIHTINEERHDARKDSRRRYRDAVLADLNK